MPFQSLNVALIIKLYNRFRTYNKSRFRHEIGIVDLNLYLK